MHRGRVTAEPIEPDDASDELRDDRDDGDAAADVAPGSRDAPPPRGSTVDEVIADVTEARDELGAFIRKQREAAKLSVRKLSRIAGVSNPYLSQIERGLRNPSAEILQSIAKALDLSAETLYVRAGILDERTDGDVASAIARDPALTEHQRATLLEMYEMFRRANGGGEAPAAAGPTDDGPRGGVVGRVIDRVTTGDVNDDDIAATALEGEDPTEA